MTDKISTSDTFKDNLKTKLTQEELAEYAKDLSEKYLENVQLEADKKGVMAEFKAKMDVVAGKMALLSQKVSTQHEWRDIDCHWSLDWTTGIKRLIREDTGEIVREEKITHTDRQKLFPIEKGK